MRKALKKKKKAVYSSTHNVNIRLNQYQPSTTLSSQIFLKADWSTFFSWWRTDGHHCTLVIERYQLTFPGICKIYEEFLKKQNPHSPQITYDASSLFEFIDKLADLSVLVFDKVCCHFPVIFIEKNHFPGQCHVRASQQRLG